MTPNNRRILSILDANRSLLTSDEKSTLEIFRQHVDDLESKHIGEREASGTMFPAEMAYILGDDNE